MSCCISYHSLVYSFSFLLSSDFEISKKIIFEILYIRGPLLTLQGGSVACSDSALSHPSVKNCPFELWAIIPVADQHSFASHGPHITAV